MQIDLGLHFSWKFGSLVGFFHKSNFDESENLASYKTGEIIEVPFLDYNNLGQPILGNKNESSKWATKQLHDLVGTAQKTHVVINETGKTEFYVLGKHKAVAPIINSIYEKANKTLVKNYRNGLRNNDIIVCEVLRINMKKNCFVLKLSANPNSELTTQF